MDTTRTRKSDVDFADELVVEDTRAIRLLRLEIETMATIGKAEALESRIRFLASELAKSRDEELIGWGEALLSHADDLYGLTAIIGDLSTIAERIPQRTPRSPFREAP